MPNVLNDLRFGLRMLRKRPGFTTAAILALALGVGANTAVFSVIRGVILRPLPYADPAQLVAIWESNPKSAVGREASSPPNLNDWIAGNQCFTSMAGYTMGIAPLTEFAEAEMLETGYVTANYFEMLGPQASLGRTIVSTDAENEVVVLSHELWDRRFGRDPHILGRKVRLGGVLRTIIGVMSPRFHDADFLHRASAEVWIPLRASDLGTDRRNDFLRVIARMKPGVPVEQARAEMTRVATGLQKQYPADNAAWTIEVHPLSGVISGDVSQALWLLLASAAGLLLIACANVANLCLARSTERCREFAIRAALGGGVARLFRQLISESLLLGLLGGAAGFLLGEWTLRGMLAFGSAYIPRVQEIRLDSSVLLFAFATSCLTAVLFGVLPARQASRAGLNDALKSASRGATSSHRRARSILVIAEVALSLVLVVAAGLLLRSFWQLEGVDLGFNRTRLLTAALRLPPDKAAPFLADLLSRIEHLPGVISAAAISGAPLTGAGHNAFVIEGRPPLGNDVIQDATLGAVTPGYFETMGIPLRIGRSVAQTDSTQATKVFLVNETFVHRYFPNEDPIGHRLSFDGKTFRTIVGVVADVHESSVADAPFPQVYVPHAQAPFQRMALVVRASLDPLSLVSAVRAQLRELDASRPLYEIHTEDELAAQSVAPRRFALTLIGLFAALALLIASIGIYGVISYTVAESTRELGIRMALGALKSDVLRMVLARGLGPVTIGILAGTLAALALARVVGSFLFQVSQYDPLTFASVAGVFIVVGLAACMIPAIRATNVDPMVALHDE
jgi:putative ABC transport system permease protein